MLWGRHVAPVGSRGANTQFSRPWLRRHASYRFVSRKVAQRVEGYEGDDGRRRMGGEFGTFPAANVGKGSMILLVDPQLYRDGSESNSSAFFLPPPRYQEGVARPTARFWFSKHRSYTLARTTYLLSRRSDRRSVSIFRPKKRPASWFIKEMNRIAAVSTYHWPQFGTLTIGQPLPVDPCSRTPFPSDSSLPILAPLERSS